MSDKMKTNEALSGARIIIWGFVILYILGAVAFVVFNIYRVWDVYECDFGGGNYLGGTLGRSSNSESCEWGVSGGLLDLALTSIFWLPLIIIKIFFN